MAESLENLVQRVARLEQALQERDMAPRTERELDVERFWARIPFSAWLKVSGPTFAVMAAGFGFLWNAQQETTLHITGVQRELTAEIMRVQRETSAEIMQVQRELSAQIMEVQRETTAQIMAHQRTTTDQILDLQRQMLELHRSERGASR